MESDVVVRAQHADTVPRHASTDARGGSATMTTILWTTSEWCAECGHPERLVITSPEGITSRCYGCGDVKVRHVAPSRSVELVGAATRTREITDTSAAR